MTQSNQFMSRNLSELNLISYSLFLLIVYTPMLFPSPPLEDVERHSQLYSGEYDWLGPYLTQNTRGQYILILLAVLITPTCMLYPKST